MSIPVNFFSVTPEEWEVIRERIDGPTPIRIATPSTFTGSELQCKCMQGNKVVLGSWTIVGTTPSGIGMNQNGKITISSGVENQTITLQCDYKGMTDTKQITLSYDNDLDIECDTIMVGVSGNVVATYNNSTVQATWAITSGGEYATIGQDGTIAIIGSGTIVVQATYGNYTTSREIEVQYQANTMSNTTVEDDGTVTTTTRTVVENQDGTTTTQTTSTTVDPEGNASYTESTITTEQDGTSVEYAVTTNQDGTTSEMEKTTNDDGSSESTTTFYDESGTPTNQANMETDASGNESTQNIVYDDEGEPVVSGYSIDTTNNSDGSKQFDGDGVNTEFYGFDSLEGFVMNLHFTIDFADQPAGQNQGHHQILTMKRANPEPWYGFQLRQSNQNKYIQLGLCLELGGNSNTDIKPQAANWVDGSDHIAEYNIQVVYDPTLFENTFVCRELVSNRVVKSSSYVFPDLPELHYLTVCIGYGLDENGDAYRYSKINVLNFSLEKLVHLPATPVVAFTENTISMSCETQNADIYYKLGDGEYAQYTMPITISQDTTVTAYATNGRRQSETTSMFCVYDDGIDEPTITCDGEYVEINCGTSGADVFYRIGTSGTFLPYSEPFEISSTVTVQAYATIDNIQSETVTETCTYVPVVVSDPTIMCNDNLVVITCPTARTTIYYRLDQTGSFVEYGGPFEISQNTTVAAYATYKSQTSNTVTESCTYTPSHDYSQDYLTFEILTSGTICWKAFGSLTKTIEYKIDNGPWTSITSTSAGATFNVLANQVVRFRGNNTQYATSKSAYSGFEGGTASFDISGNIMSLLYGDGFASNTALTNATYQFCSLFKKALVVSARNLILPATTLKAHCYRAMFSWCTTLVVAPALPATTLATYCYWYMFEQCAITTAPTLNATTLVAQCYGHMFDGCAQLNTIQCFATSGFGSTDCLTGWTTGVAGTGTFVKASSASSWTPNSPNGIPTGWNVQSDLLLYAPVITFDGEYLELDCATDGATIYYKLGASGSYQTYDQPVAILEDATVYAYSSLEGHDSDVVSQECVVVVETKYEQSNKTLSTWTYGGNTITTPYSVNRIDGHSSRYDKGTFQFSTSIVLKDAQPTYLWFQHADQSADIYVDDVKVETHWGGYTSFFSDISEYVHRGTNNIRVALCNTTRQTLAPAAGDFNFNATLGNVKLFTSPYLPDKQYGYDGFHITSTVTSSAATIYVKTTVPSGATLTCTITDDDGFSWSGTKTSNGQEQTFTTTISGNDLTLWDGTIDPHLYNVKLEISKDNELYHRFERPYGFRYYSYVVNQTINGASYTGFLLNGHPYALRGVCVHDDVEGKANALNDADYDQEFAIIRELNCNFLRLAHYPHPREVYDRCDQLGIIVQTEGPCVNKFQSTMPADYYTHLTGQYTDMVQQHYNHPCILFWGLFNETSTDDKAFGKAKIEEYYALIKGMDAERWVGYVMSHSYNNPAAYYNDPNVDWFGSNLYVGWYINQGTNDPTSAINSRVDNTIGRLSKPIALSEYGCGGTRLCHSDDFMNTTTKGNNPRHDIEYMMWLHEGHIAAIKNFPQLLFTAEWQLFDIAVSNRNEGYTINPDGIVENATTDDNLRRLNNKGLVERDHTTKKDPFYLYKAEWNPTPFVHICGKDYTKIQNRVLKCYTNAGSSLRLYNGETLLDTAQVNNHIAEFTAMNFTSGVEYRVEGDSNTYDTVTFE